MFEETHRLALALVRDGLVDGLRIDHPDGLADPEGYLRAAARRGRRARVGGEDPRPGRAAAGVVAGRRDGRLRVPQRRGGAVRRPGRRGPPDRALGRPRRRRCAPSASTPTRPSWSRRPPPSPRKCNAFTASSRATTCPRRCPRCRCTGPTSASGRRRRTSRSCREAGIEWLLDAPPEFVTRFQQTTPPVMAKGVEDTAFYRYLRLLALNDVGGDPGRFGLSVEDFHAANAARRPLNLLVTQTHDTKRSGDVRARIGALAGMAEEWEAHVRGWLSMLEAVPGPDAAERYLVFQTLVGRVADRARAARRVPREGAARGEAHDELDRARRGARGGGQGVRARARRPARVPRGLRPVRGRGRGGRRAGRARPAGCSS